MPQLYSDSYKKLYKARCCSASAFCCYILAFITIVVPFFLCYYTNNFYNKVDTYFEFPQVSFLHEYAIEVVEDTSGAITDKFFTTYPRYTEENYNTLAPPYFSFYTDDENGDGRPEKFVFDITVQGVTTANIRNLIIALSFQYDIDDFIEAKMKSLAFFQIESPNGLGRVNAYGSLKLKQLHPIDNSYSEKTVYNVNALEKVLNASLINTYTNYTQRQETTEFEGNILVEPFGDSTDVNINIEMLIPKQQEIMYKPGVLESLKSAWIQYIFVLIAFYFVCIAYVLRFMLSNQIIETHISNNLPKAQDVRWYRKFKELGFETT